MNNSDHEDGIRIGWATRDITPDQNVILGAQFKMRVSEGVDGPVTVTAMALSAGESPADAVIFVACDRGGFRHKWYDKNDFLTLCQEAIRARSSEIDPDTVILNATHTHTAPMTLVNQFGPEAEVLPEGVMTAEEYMEFQTGRIADAVVEAWNNRHPTGVSFGLGTAVVGHNRRATYFAEGAWWLVSAPWLLTYCPVVSEYRAGTQMGHWVKALRTSTPSWARRSMCGLLSTGKP